MEKIRKDVILLYQKGIPKRQIARKVHTRFSNVKKIIDDYNTGKSKNNMQEKENAPDENPEELTMPPGKEMDQMILDRGVKGYTKLAGDYLSDELLKEYKTSLKVADIIRSAEMRYRSAVESMDYNWEDFLLESIELGYKKLKEREEVWAIMGSNEKKPRLEDVDSFKQELKDSMTKAVSQAMEAYEPMKMDMRAFLNGLLGIALLKQIPRLISD